MPVGSITDELFTSRAALSTLTNSLVLWDLRDHLFKNHSSAYDEQRGLALARFALHFNPLLQHRYILLMQFQHSRRNLHHHLQLLLSHQLMWEHRPHRYCRQFICCSMNWPKTKDINISIYHVHLALSVYELTSVSVNPHVLTINYHTINVPYIRCEVREAHQLSC